MKAKGIYQCYDANNLNIPVSNVTIDVASINKSHENDATELI